MTRSFSFFSRQGREAYQWHTLKKQDLPAAETFLLEQEKECVAACARFLHPARTGRIWFLPDKAENIVSLLLYSCGSLIPVLGENKDVPAPRSFNRFVNFNPIHSVQGITRDVGVFEVFLSKMERRSTSRIDYDLMHIDREPQAGAFLAGPSGLILRAPDMTDIEALFPLQEAYEWEEVLPQDAFFSPASCRLSLERIVSREYALVACLGGRIVGKINTNAESFNRYQIGGVYVHADYRGLGIATVMTAALVRDLIVRGKGVSLFVKKQNDAARAVYRHIGFMGAGDYRIIYY